MTNYGLGARYSLRCVINTYRLKDVKVRGSSLPWITNTIRLKINLRYKLLKLAVNTRCPLKWDEHKKIRNEITTDLRQAKTKYLNDFFCEIKTTN